MQKNNIPGSKLNHGGRKLYIINYKTLQKEIKTKISGKTSWVHEWEDNTTQSIIEFRTIPMKIPMASSLSPPPLPPK